MKKLLCISALLALIGSCFAEPVRIVAYGECRLGSLEKSRVEVEGLTLEHLCDYESSHLEGAESERIVPAGRKMDPKTLIAL
jgi:hypothetical protein